MLLILIESFVCGYCLEPIQGPPEPKYPTNRNSNREAGICGTFYALVTAARPVTRSRSCAVEETPSQASIWCRCLASGRVRTHDQRPVSPTTCHRPGSSDASMTFRSMTRYQMQRNCIRLSANARHSHRMISNLYFRGRSFLRNSAHFRGNTNASIQSENPTW